MFRKTVLRSSFGGNAPPYTFSPRSLRRRRCRSFFLPGHRRNTPAGGSLWCINRARKEDPRVVPSERARKIYELLQAHSLGNAVLVLRSCRRDEEFHRLRTIFVFFFCSFLSSFFLSFSLSLCVSVNQSVCFCLFLHLSVPLYFCLSLCRRLFLRLRLPNSDSRLVATGLVVSSIIQYPIPFE